MSSELADDDRDHEQEDERETAFIDAIYDVFCAVRTLEGLGRYSKKLRAITREKVPEHLCFGLLHNETHDIYDLGITVLLQAKSKPVDNPDADVKVSRHQYAELNQPAVHAVVSQLSDAAKKAILDTIIPIITEDYVRKLEKERKFDVVENMPEAITKLRERIMRL